MTLTIDETEGFVILTLDEYNELKEMADAAKTLRTEKIRREMRDLNRLLDKTAYTGSRFDN